MNIRKFNSWSLFDELNRDLQDAKDGKSTTEKNCGARRGIVERR